MERKGRHKDESIIGNKNTQNHTKTTNLGSLDFLSDVLRHAAARDDHATGAELGGSAADKTAICVLTGGDIFCGMRLEQRNDVTSKKEWN